MALDGTMLLPSLKACRRTFCVVLIKNRNRDNCKDMNHAFRKQSEELRRKPREGWQYQGKLELSSARGKKIELTTMRV